MKIKAVFLCAISSAVLALAGALPENFYGGDNLVPALYFKDDVSFCNRGRTWGKNVRIDQAGVATIQAATQGVPPTVNLWGITPRYLLDGDSALHISFRYRTTAAAGFSTSFQRQETGPFLRGGKLKGDSRKLDTATDWTEFKAEVPVPLGADYAVFSFRRPATGSLQLKDLSIRERYPQASSGRPLLIKGQECEAIYWMRSRDPFTNNDYLAAQMLSFAFRRCGGKILPIRELTSAKDQRRCAIYLGKAAEKSGAVKPTGLQGKLPGVTAGGASIRVADHQVGIAGHTYFGTGFGVWTFLREQLGISYLANNFFAYPKAGSYQVQDCQYVANPRIGIRYPYCSNVERCELRGFCPTLIAQQELVYGNQGGAGHPALAIVPYDEFGKTHPEFFALQADGTRLKSRNSHYCNTNEAFIKLFTQRLLETMRANPYCHVFRVYAGDGGGMSCTCKACKALGNQSDMFIYFANRVAEVTSREFPENYVATISYVDTTEPPTRIKPHKNVVALYTHYEPRAWGAQQNYNHEFNKIGKQYLDGWEAFMPENMALEGHFTLYGELLNVYPQFNFIEAMVRRASRKGYKVMDTFYYNTPYGDVNGSQSFCELAYYIMGRLMADPELDVNASVAWFIQQYYGPAAKTMQTYFDLIQQEPMKQNWAQFCEQVKRGFVTQQLAERCLALLYQAEREAGDDIAFRKHVLREQIPMLFAYLSDVCRGRGNVTSRNFSFYAAALQKFCKISQEMGTLVYGGRGAHHWMKNSAMLAIGKGYWWYRDPVVQKLIEAPEQTLGKLPLLQEPIPGGWQIPPKGLFGGETMQTNWMRKDNGWAACVRRPILGGSISTVLVRVNLKDTPAQPMKLFLRGIDNEKTDVATMELRVNDQVIYRGAVPWSKQAWSLQSFKIPQGLLKKGENDVVILNTTPEKEEAALCGAAFTHQTPSRSNPYWGWFIIDQLQLRQAK